jgi:hypothetical protein
MTNLIGDRLAVIIALSVVVACITVPQVNRRSVEGIYRNYALGFSINIPHGLKGTAGDEAGPERGPAIRLASGGKIIVFGEPNGLEWKNPDEGMKYELAHEACGSAKPDISPARIGKLVAVKGSLECDGRVLYMMLVFRTKGGPIYWLRLETDRAHRTEDQEILETVAASFKLIPWR